MRTLLSSKNLMGIIVASVILLATLGSPYAASAQSSCGTTYTVQRGDYLTKIARTCGVSYSDLLKANPSIANPSLIFPSQITAMTNTEQGIVVSFTCWCGAEHASCLLLPVQLV